jgi:uncharacterized protein (TIGR02271 family)
VLRQLSGYEIADDSPDVRGWELEDADEQRIGRIDDLIVDTESLTARYLLVQVEPTAASASARTILVPTSRAQVNGEDRTVRTDVTIEQARAFPPYSGTIAGDYDDTLPAAERPVPDGAQGRTPSAGSGSSARLTRSAEELTVGRREVPTGEVRVRKHVETEHVRQPVTRTKEEVRVERRPASEGTSRGRAEIRDEEIRVPIVEEELVVEKRPVVKEEVVVSKERTQETKTVEADLRKEEIDVDRIGGEHHER